MQQQVRIITTKKGYEEIIEHGRTGDDTHSLLALFAGEQRDLQ